MQFNDDPDNLDEFLDAFHGQDYRKALDYVDTYCRNRIKYVSGLHPKAEKELESIRDLIRQQLEATPWGTR